jgi:ribosomal protein S11
MAKATKKKTKKVVNTGIVTIQSTFNNTIVSITDTEGDVQHLQQQKLLVMQQRKQLRSMD